MKWVPFETRVPGKWVLAGEHSVLRGQVAVALPHPDFSLTLRFFPGDGGFEAIPPQSQILLSEILSSALDGQLPSGRLEIESSIPVGAGLGSSAALCVALTQWLAPNLDISPSRQFEFARKLENRFHGKSSGLDIAAALSAVPISFFMSGPKEGAHDLGVKRLPKFTFHDTGLRASTSECVRQVQELIARDPGKGARIDAQMGEASRLAAEGLMNYSAQKTGPEPALELLARGMGLAQGCFEAWGLVPDSAGEIIANLRARGARAAKLTGAGKGGIIVALE